MDYVALLSNAFSAGAGAFAGALAAYFLALRQEKNWEISEYLSLLLLIHEHLDAVYKVIVEIPPKSIKEVNGEKVVALSMPFPEFSLTPNQMQMLMKVAPDKQMPAALIHFSNFLKTHSSKIAKDGVNILPLEYVNHQAWQLKFMLTSVRVQYEQQTNDAFPIVG